MEKPNSARPLQDLVIEVRMAQFGCRELRDFVESQSIINKHYSLVGHFLGFVEASLRDAMDILARQDVTRCLVKATHMFNARELVTLEDGDPVTVPVIDPPPR